MTNLYNKEFITQKKKEKARKFSDIVKDTIKRNKKHFVLVYEANEIDPTKSIVSFDCANISMNEIASVMKQFILSVSSEPVLKGN
jgi:predicted transcriptional regulator